jgi:hypothetical protein
MKRENITLIKRVGKNGTNDESLKKKLKFKKPYSTTSSSCWKQLENKQKMKDLRFMKWNNCIN